MVFTLRNSSRPMSDTLLRLRLFAAVYEERSFTAAAERENATQSGVTQHVRKLEDAHGVSLFVRDGRTVRPTPAGDAYYGHCIEVLRAHERSRSAVREFKDTLSGEVVVGLTPTTTRGVLAPALARFVQSHPNVVVRVVDAYSDIVTDKLRTGPDAGLVVCPLVEPALMLDLYLIERARHPRSSEADAFLAVLEQETAKASAQAQRMMERGPSRARDQAR